MALYDAQKILLAAVLEYVVKRPPQTVYHWTVNVAKQLTYISRSFHPSEIGRSTQYLALKQSEIVPVKVWSCCGVRSFSSYPNLYSSLPFERQSLKKHAIVVQKSEKTESVLKNTKQEHVWGKKYFLIFPDILTFIRAAVIASSGILVGWIFYPGFADRKSALQDPTLQYNSAIELTDKKHMMLKLYLLFPWRALSRAWGRASSSVEIPVYVRPYIYGLYSKVYNVNLDEAVNADFKSYANMSEFFRRAIKSSVRPVDAAAELVSPVDGKILHLGKVINGAVEQVKGVTYSLQKFLGPLHSDPLHDEWGKPDLYQHNWCSVPLENYMKASMHNPSQNDLYHCVIYLAPGDYHRFHSPVDWIVQHRRHFPGDLLSVNPKIASVVPSLFVLNERVALLGKWRHGFFSMTAVGATNVGSVEIYGDVTLKTNRPKRVYGGYYDTVYDDVPASKGIGMGEFNLGSTIVLIFEAPKTFKYSIDAKQKVLYGSPLQRV